MAALAPSIPFFYNDFNCAAKVRSSFNASAGASTLRAHRPNYQSRL